MSYRPSPYRVRYRPSPDGVSSRPGPCRRPVCPCHADGTDAGRSHTDVSLCRTAISAHRSPFIGIGVRENRRSPPPMPNGDDRASIPTGHRPGIVRASSGQNGTSWGRCTTGPPGRMREATRHKTRKKCAGTSPDITDHHQTSSDIIGHHRVREGCRVPYGPSPGTVLGMVVPCRIARSDRVRYRPSPTPVSSYPGPIRRLLCSCRTPGRASGTPVICQAPAQHTPVADAANRCVANIFSLVRRGAS